MSDRDASDDSPLPSLRQRFWQAALASLIATVLLAWPALGGAFLMNPNSEQHLTGYAFREFASASLKAGQGMPLWNPYLFGGLPYVGAMHGDLFYPTQLLRLILPTDLAMTWGLILHLVLAGVFTYGFLQAVGVRHVAAIVGGVAYLLSGIMASTAAAGDDGKLFVSALTPAALWAITRGVRDGRAASWGVLAMVVGMAVLSPHPQQLQYMLLLGVSFALWLAWRPHAVPGHTVIANQTERQISWRRLATAAGAVVLGGLIGAVQVLPVREYMAWSPRSGGLAYGDATAVSLPLVETITAYLPQFTGMLESYWGSRRNHLHSEYLGAAVMALAGLAVQGGLTNRHRRHAWFWLGVVVVSLLWAWGGYTPFYQLVYAVVPGTQYFRAPSSMFLVTAFAVSVLSALGADHALTGRVSGRYLVAWVGGALLVAAVATAGWLTNMAIGIAPYERAEAVAANAPAMLFGAWRSAASVLAVAAALATIRRAKVTAAFGGWLLAAVVAIDLWSVARHYWRFSPPAAQLYAEDDIIRYLKATRDPARVLVLPLGEDQAPTDPFVAGNALMTHGVRSVLGYHGNELGRYRELYGQHDRYESVANPNFWALTNARFLYTNVPGLPFPGAHLVAGPVANAAGTMTYLYELPGVHPAAWVAPLRVYLDDATARTTVLNPLFDLRRVAVFEKGEQVGAAPTNSPFPSPVPFGVEISNYVPGSIDLALQGPAPAGSTLIVSENYYPGWTAQVDGQPATVRRADFTLIGVELPAGARTVRLRFTSEAYESGKLLTVLALGAALLWWIVGRASDRRQVAA